MSIHTDRSKEVARTLGGFAGQPDASPLWELSKRELVEVAMRLGARCCGDADDAASGARGALAEADTLRANGII